MKAIIFLTLFLLQGHTAQAEPHWQRWKPKVYGCVGYVKVNAASYFVGFPGYPVGPNEVFYYVDIECLSNSILFSATFPYKITLTDAGPLECASSDNKGE